MNKSCWNLCWLGGFVGGLIFGYGFVGFGVAMIWYGIFGAITGLALG